VFVTFLIALDVICRDATSEIRLSLKKAVTMGKSDADDINDEGMTGVFPLPHISCCLCL
jgi:hypothetical protein